MKAIIEVWRRFQRLSGADRSVVLEAAAGLMATWLGLRLAGFKRWKSALERLTPAGVTPPDIQRPGLAESARAIARLEAAAARHLFFHSNCLEQSLVLWWLLRRRGIGADIRVGGRKEADRFEAHAWVEYDGAALSDQGAGHLHFVPFDGPITPMEV